MAILMDEKSWKLGHQDGLDGTRKNKDNADNKLSYESGYIEGKADQDYFYNFKQVELDSGKLLAAGDEDVKVGDFFRYESWCEDTYKTIIYQGIIKKIYYPYRK